VEHDLDVVSVGVDDERRVVVAAVWALAGPAVVLPAGRDRGGVKRIDLRRVGRSECDVAADVRRVAALERERLASSPASPRPKPSVGASSQTSFQPSGASAAENARLESRSATGSLMWSIGTQIVLNCSNGWRQLWQ
jgi:hypothetical protein